jgi:prepilin-type processing-associated H-X9-DG protein
MKYTTSHRHNGFTILEMMIVAVVIFILALALVPVLTSAKDRAKAVQCTSNLHGLYVMWQSKRGEDSYIPMPTDPRTRLHDAEWPAGYLGWAKANGAETNLFVCPADPNPYQSPVVVMGQYSSANQIVGMFGIEEPVLQFTYPVPNPREFDRKGGGAWDWGRLRILQNTNQTATITVVSGGYNTSYIKFFDETRTNQLLTSSDTTVTVTNKYANNNATLTVPTMASSYGYNYVDVMTYTNQCSPNYESYVQVLGWPDDATRTVLLMDYPVSHVRCALCYGYYGWATISSPCTSPCCYCGTNAVWPYAKTTTPGPADNWDANAMGPAIGRHKGRCNVIFQDGSASTYKPAEIDPRANMWQYKTYIVGTTTNRIQNRLWRSVHGEGKNWLPPL